ncbi:hypothetical protein [Pseudomonas sp. BF-R-24]|uniref:restriction endonuclease subunit S n=1 Tax=Pseudomonas sp. BF-R-24 TaxID=2832386 RepID=UPI001CBAFA13|nr:hypothetical protein [Pseudomonas sp. BF-R-24]
MSFPKYPEYKDSEGEWSEEVPAHWTLTPIKYMALLNPRKSGFSGDTEQLCSFLPMEKLKTGVVQLDEERPIEEVIGGYTYFEDGDVLQAKVTPCFENKNIAIAKGLTNGIGFGSSEINVLRPYPGVNAEYLYYRVQEDSYMNFCTSSMIGAGGLKRVPTDVINNFKVAAPEIFEQTQIARFLDHETARINALIEEQQRLIELLKEKRQAVISHTVTKGLDPTVPMKDSGVEWLGEVPAHWEVLATKRFFRMVTDPAPNDNDYELLSVYTEIGVRPRKELEQKGNKASTTDGYWRVKRGDLIVNKLLAWMGAVGYSDYDGVTSPAYDILRPSRQLSPKFYHYIFRGKPAQQEFKRWSRGIMEMRLRLYFDELGRISMPFPPIGEQEKIVDFIETMEAKFESLSYAASEQVRLLSERRSALISAAVTGKIDVRGWQPPVSAQAPTLEQEAV